MRHLKINIYKHETNIRTWAVFNKFVVSDYFVSILLEIRKKTYEENLLEHHNMLSNR